MADESEKPPVTDSRFPGFNPEVEESKAAAEAAAAPPEPPKPATVEAPPRPRDPLAILQDIEAWVRNTHGSHPRFDELWKELMAGLEH
jgi:hypothetical protein